MKTWEVNFDGLVGPTHNYAGLAIGNKASVQHAFETSNPRAAVKQGLAKMQLLMKLGLKQAILPPHERPNLVMLRQLGFSGNTEKILRQVYKENPRLFAACYSASSMWVANAATVSPSVNCHDQRVHFTPANLMSYFHRAQETIMTTQLLKRIFSNESHFIVHSALPSVNEFSDEGAANHTYFCNDYEKSGVELFVYGKLGFGKTENLPQHFPARQSLAAFSAIARLHELELKKIVFAQQNPEAIDQGVFHNDVISVGHRNVFFYHEYAFVNKEQVMTQLQNSMNGQMHFIEVKNSEVNLSEAVKTYLFNSQLISLADNTMALIAPSECQESKIVQHYLTELLKQNTPIKQIHYVDCRQSMQNGGGPACLRLRVVLTEEQIAASHSGVYLTDELYQQLIQWADKHYREELILQDLLDPKLVEENYAALDELTKLLQLGSIYRLQKN